ncbi:hypothetical protein IAT38_001544 [Cryptococcus sp. DSM 104549]
MGALQFMFNWFGKGNKAAAPPPPTVNLLFHAPPPVACDISTPKPRVDNPTDKAVSRMAVLTEIYATEQTYVRNLKEVHDVYIKAAPQLVEVKRTKLGRNKTKTQFAIADEDRKVLFAGLSEILALHKKHILPAMRHALGDLLEKGDDEHGKRSVAASTAMAQVFLQYLAYLKMYAAYSISIHESNAKLVQWRSGKGMTKKEHARVQAYLAACQANPAHSLLDLGSYTILPIQRITRYNMLIADLERFTPPPPLGKQRDYVGEATARLSTLSLFINEYKREYDSRARLSHWEDLIPTPGPSPLIQPHRRLMREGPVHFIKRGPSPYTSEKPSNADSPSDAVPRSLGKVDQDCIAVLCHDMLVLASTSKKGWDSYKLCDVVRMSAMEGKAYVKDDNVVVFEAYNATYHLRVSDNTQAETWAHAINRSRLTNMMGIH